MNSILWRISALLTAAAILFGISVLALNGQIDTTIPASIVSKNGLSVNTNAQKKTVILDPGHGGEDGGAVASDGTAEKELNLLVALRARDLLQVCGFDVVMTRSEDVMTGNGEKGRKKLADLQYRLTLANSTPDGVLVSIHMNKFPQSSVKGIRLFYAPGAQESAALCKAFETQAAILQNGKVPPGKAADSSIYLLDRAKIPAVLLECGFLSNPEEKERLQSKAYQQKLSAMILAALCENEKSAGGD